MIHLCLSVSPWHYWYPVLLLPTYRHAEPHGLRRWQHSGTSSIQL